LLASGEIADLFPIEDKDAIINSVTNATKNSNVTPTRDNCWNFFINRVKTNLHMSICCSPVGEDLRQRATKFPALINNTVIDWFQPWPYEALLSVSDKFLSPLELGDEKVSEAIVRFMPYSFDTVLEVADKIKEVEKKVIYITPKSFLELIALFVNMLSVKRQDILDKKERLEIGLCKLRETSEVVAVLEEDLKVISVEVEEKKKESEGIAEVVGKEKAIVDIEAAKASEEGEKCVVIQKEVSAQAAHCETELAKALPLVEKACAALDGLDVKEMQTLKSFSSPPGGVDDVTACCQYLLAGIHPAVTVDKRGKVGDVSWKEGKKLLNEPAKFIVVLKELKDIIDNGKLPK